jgi:hypothetical protein
MSLQRAAEWRTAKGTKGESVNQIGLSTIRTRTMHVTLQ